MNASLRRIKEAANLSRRARHFWERLVVSIALLSVCSFFAWSTDLVSRMGHGFFYVMLSLAFFCSLFILLGWFFYCVHRYHRKWYSRVVALGVLFVWGCLTFFSLSHDLQEKSVEQVPFFARVVTLPNRATAALLVQRLETNRFPSTLAQYNYHIFKLAVVFYLGALMFSFLGRAVFNRIRIGLTRDRNKYVFWGLSSRELVLARSLVSSSNTAQIQFNLPIEDSYDAVARARLTDLADELDAFWLFLDYGQLGPKCHKGRTHFFISDDGQANLALANQLLVRFMEDKTCCQEKVFYIRTGEGTHERLFSSWASRAYEASGHFIRPMIIREAEMIASSYIRKYPILSASLPEGRFTCDHVHGTVSGTGCRTLLLGLDRTGVELLNATLLFSRMVKADGQSFLCCPITVVDKDEECWHRYARQAPEIVARRQRYGLEFKKMKVGGDEFEAWFRANYQNYDRIVMCLSEDGVNIREALRIRALLVESAVDDGVVQILVRVSSPSVSDVGQLHQIVRVPICCFGSFAEIYSTDSLINDPLERIAKVLNWERMVNLESTDNENHRLRIESEGDIRVLNKEQDDDIERCWENAEFFERKASRAMAMGMMAYVRLLGVRCVRTTDSVAGNVVPWREMDKLISTTANEALAHLEHMRWCVYWWAMGSSTWDLKSPKSLHDVIDANPRYREGVTNEVANQLMAFHRHAALIDYHELPKLDLEFANALGRMAPGGSDKPLYTDGFANRIHLESGGVSLQGKAKLYWSVFAEAAALSGFHFVQLEPACPNGKAGERGGSDSNGETHHVDRTPPRKRLGILKRWKKFRRRVKRQPLNEGEQEDLSIEELREVAEYADWTAKAYEDDVVCPSDKSGSADVFAEFLSSKIVEKKIPLPDDDSQEGCEKPRYTVFWFDDAITPHFGPLELKHGGKTRYPYCFDHKTGLIKPFAYLPREDRQKFMESSKDVSERRVNFQSQPNFVAQIFSFEDRVVIIFRGTKITFKDLYEDVIQYFGLMPAQFRVAADLVQAVCKTTKKKILLLGHSEGGGEVQYAILKNYNQYWSQNGKLEGVTFNVQRLSPWILKDLRRQRRSREARKYIKNFRSRRDVVSGLSALGVRPIGKVYSVGEHGSIWGIEGHKIIKFIDAINRYIANKEKDGKTHRQ